MDKEAFIEGYVAGRLDSDNESPGDARADRRRADAEQEWTIRYGDKPQPNPRLEALQDVFHRLTLCPIYGLTTRGPNQIPVNGLGLKREDLSAALAELNGGVIPRRSRS